MADQTQTPKPKKCRFCRKPYIPRVWWQKFCKTKCRWNAWLVKKQLELPEAGPSAEEEVSLRNTRRNK